jgi:SAM-dependent methyltransferase
VPVTAESSGDDEGRGPPTPARIRVFGRMLNRLVVRAPWAWPLVRGPIRRFFDRAASGWDQRTTAGSVNHLAPLAAALLHVRPAPERALEVGTGTGEGALLISREFPQARVRGVDLSEEMIVASSWGSATPFYTPDAVLDWRFAKEGIEPAGAGHAGEGTFWVGRKPLAG